MNDDEVKALIDDLRLNHEYCPKEVILKAADVIEQLSQRPWVGMTDVVGTFEIAKEGTVWLSATNGLIFDGETGKLKSAEVL